MVCILKNPLWLQGEEQAGTEKGLSDHGSAPRDRDVDRSEITPEGELTGAADGVCADCEQKRTSQDHSRFS